VLEKSKSINLKTLQLTHVEDILLKEMTNLVGFLIIDFFVAKDLKMLTYLVGFLIIHFFAVKDLKRLAFLLHVLTIKANKTNPSTFITGCS
jgi:hypothetical protein